MPTQLFVGPNAPSGKNTIVPRVTSPTAIRYSRRARENSVNRLSPVELTLRYVIGGSRFRRCLICSGTNGWHGRSTSLARVARDLGRAADVRESFRRFIAGVCPAAAVLVRDQTIDCLYSDA